MYLVLKIMHMLNFLERLVWALHNDISLFTPLKGILKLFVFCKTNKGNWTIMCVDAE
jgi:hypothetical protein